MLPDPVLPDPWPKPPDVWPVLSDGRPGSPYAMSCGTVFNLERFDCLANVPSSGNCVAAAERDEEEGKEGSLANGGLKMRKSDDTSAKRVPMVLMVCLC